MNVNEVHNFNAASRSGLDQQGFGFRPVKMIGDPLVMLFRFKIIIRHGELEIRELVASSRHFPRTLSAGTDAGIQVGC